MSWQIVQNPETEHYQIYSSVVDAFLLDYEVSREELENFWVGSRGEQSLQAFSDIIEALDAGKVPPGYYMTYEKAKMWDTHQAEHGPKSRQPDTCIICKEILQDEENDRKKK